MRKQLIALALTFVLAALVIACGRNTGTTGYVEPAMEGTTTMTAASELSSESATQVTESETATQAEAATSFSAGTTAQALVMNTIRAANTAQPAAAAPTAPAAAPKPQTQAPAPQPVSEYEVMGPEYLGIIINTLNEIRAERGLAPMVMNADLMASSLAHAKKMAEAGTSFHSDPPPGFESVGYVPHHVFTAQMLGEDLTTHVSNFTQDGYFSVGIAVVKRGDYLYAVMQGNR